MKTIHSHAGAGSMAMRGSLMMENNHQSLSTCALVCFVFKFYYNETKKY